MLFRILIYDKGKKDTLKINIRYFSRINEERVLSQNVFDIHFQSVFSFSFYAQLLWFLFIIN